MHLDTKLSRAEFQKMTSDLLDRCKSPFQQVIKDAGISLPSINHVVLVGGSTRMPAVVDLVKDLGTGNQQSVTLRESSKASSEETSNHGATATQPPSTTRRRARWRKNQPSTASLAPAPLPSKVAPSDPDP